MYGKLPWAMATAHWPSNAFHVFLGLAFVVMLALTGVHSLFIIKSRRN